MSEQRDTEQQLVVFRVGDGDEFALPIDRVQEVVRYEEPRPVASSVPWMRGVMSLRGSVLPVCDLAERLRLPAGTEPTRLLISLPTASHDQVAYAVGSVASIVTVPESAIEPLATDGGRHDPAVTAVAHVDERIIVVLDADHLMPHRVAPAATHDSGDDAR